MQIVIKTPEDLVNERLKLLDEFIHVVQRQERSCARYADTLLKLRRKIRKIDKQLGE